MDTPPSATNVLGVGGLIPWLSQWYAVPEAKVLSGKWSGDRWALWEFPDDESILLLETRWQDAEAARNFREAIPYHPYQRVLKPEAGSNRVQLLRGNCESVFTRFPAVYQDAPHKGAP